MQKISSAHVNSFSLSMIHVKWDTINKSIEAQLEESSKKLIVRNNEKITGNLMNVKNQINRKNIKNTKHLINAINLITQINPIRIINAINVFNLKSLATY